MKTLTDTTTTQKVFSTQFRSYKKYIPTDWAEQFRFNEIFFQVGLYHALQKIPSFLSYSRSTSSFWRFFFPWMCIRVFFSSVNFHLFNHSESLATYITGSCFLFMLPACQVVRQVHKIDSKAPHYLDLSPVTNSLHGM